MNRDRSKSRQPRRRRLSIESARRCRVCSALHNSADFAVDLAARADPRHGGCSQLSFRVGVGLGRDAAQVRRLRHRRLDEDRRQRRGARVRWRRHRRLDRRRPPSSTSSAWSSAGVTHHFQRGDRKRHADADLGRPDLGVGADQAAVARAREHAPARDGGTVDRGHRRSRIAEQRVERVGQRREQPIGVVGPALAAPGRGRPRR